MGVGILNWTCPLAARSQFVVKNFDNYEEVFTVEDGTGTQCRQEKPTVTTSFAYGTLNADIYQSFTATSYSPTTIIPLSQLKYAGFTAHQEAS